MAYVAIQTKFLGPTDHRGARIKATAMDRTCSDGVKKSVTIPYDYGATTEARHRQAAELLLPQVVNHVEDVELIEGGWERGYIYIPVYKALLTCNNTTFNCGKGE